MKTGRKPITLIGRLGPNIDDIMFTGAHKPDPWEDAMGGFGFGYGLGVLGSEMREYALLCVRGQFSSLRLVLRSNAAAEVSR